MYKIKETAERLLNGRITISCAESCTGGMVSATLADFPGISAVFTEGVVTYANEAKVRLGVNPDTLKEHGAVSHAVAGEMAKAVRLRASSDIGVSTTGIAGPGGGTERKPVGLVYVGISTKKNTKTFALRLFGDRQTIRQKTVKAVFHFIYKELEDMENGKN